MVDVLLLEGNLVRELHMAVQILKAGSLAKANPLVVDEAILYVVDVLHNCVLIKDKGYLSIQSAV
jgi:hypothetical protein